MARRPRPILATPPKVPLLTGAALFVAMGGVLVVVAVRTGAAVVGINAILPVIVGAVLAFVALRQRVRVDRNGVYVEGFGSAGRRVGWKDVKRLELTDVTPLRTSPRLVVKTGRTLPVPPSWRTEDGTRLPEAVLAWARSMKVEVVGERLTARRWPIAVIIIAGAMVGGLASLFA